jgi:hypothetical protein
MVRLQAAVHLLKVTGIYGMGLNLKKLPNTEEEVEAEAMAKHNTLLLKRESRCRALRLVFNIQWLKFLI